MKERQVSQVIGVLLSPQCQQVEAAIVFLTENKDAARILIETDLPLAVQLVQQEEQTKGKLNKLLNDIKDKLT